jgi:toxin-antitoxin system PIN domain toxin
VIILDASILLYAVDRSSPRHEPAKAWLEAALSGGDEVGFPLVSLLAFIRIGTDPRVYQTPLPTSEAIDLVRSWLERANAGLVQPSAAHWLRLHEQAEKGRARGALVMAAHLAALAIEHGATVCSTDRDLARFKGVKVIDPTS